MEKQTENNAVALGKSVENENYVKFKKPFEYEGKSYDGIALDLDSLTGLDVEEAEVQFIAKNPGIAAQTPLKEMSKGFQAILAAKAAGVIPEFLSALPAGDYAKVTTKVQVFLLKAD